MIHHMVLFKFKPDIDDDAKLQFAAALSSLKGEIGAIKSLSHGSNFSERSQGFDYALSVLVEDRDGLESYRVHPSHKQVLEEIILPAIESSLAVDYEY